RLAGAGGDHGRRRHRLRGHGLRPRSAAPPAAAGRLPQRGVEPMSDPIVLAFSGGLDTSFCIPWLAETCGRPVVTVTVNTGGIDAAAAADLARRSRALGAVDHLLVDAREAFFERVLRFLILGN